MGRGRKKKNNPSPNGEDVINALSLISDCDKRKVRSTRVTETTLKSTLSAITQPSEATKESFSLHAE